MLSNSIMKNPNSSESKVYAMSMGKYFNIELKYRGYFFIDKIKAMQ